LVAVRLLVLQCCAAGLLARAALGRALSASFEDRLQTIYPRCTIVERMTQAAAFTG
jgi:hypothetical protein